jgi:hypothetical protein
VSVSHTLTPAAVTYLKAQTHARQSGKNKKYASVASRLGAELLNVVVDTSGGMTAGAMGLVGAIGEEGERWSAGTWTSAAITRHLLGAIAVFVTLYQKGGGINSNTDKTLCWSAVCTAFAGRDVDVCARLLL